jgi:hypothetical protein
VDFRIRHYKGDEATDEHWSQYTLEEANDILCRWQREGTVDRVEIRNAKDELLFHYPREMHPV